MGVVAVRPEDAKQILSLFPEDGKTSAVSLGQALYPDKSEYQQRTQAFAKLLMLEKMGYVEKLGIEGGMRMWGMKG